MAIDAGFLPAFEVAFHLHHVLFIVALEAELLAIFQKQFLLAGLVRIVAGATFAIASGVMFESCCFKLLLEIIMALKAELSVRFDQELLVVRNMRTVAGTAFVVLHRLVFDLCCRELLLDVLMALKAKLPIRLQQEMLLV